MKHWIVYETINNINGMSYSGCHLTVKYEFDGYLGSGRRFLKAVKKYGKENFTRRTLAKFFTQEDALFCEKMLIGKRWREASNYNALPGGGFVPDAAGEKNGFYGKHHTPETKAKLSANHGRPWKGRTLSNAHKKKISEALKRTHARKKVQ